MEMSPEQLDQLSLHLCQSLAGKVGRRLEGLWQVQRPSSGNGDGERGHAIIEPKYDQGERFLGDERFWNREYDVRP